MQSEHFDTQNPRQITPPELTSPIRLKDALDTISKYDGHKISVFHFSKICERAPELTPQYHEYHLVQLVINKLEGHAYAVMEGIEFNSLFELTRRSKKIFGPNKSVDQYRGELANIFMKPNENIFDYIIRIQELRTAIVDGETSAIGYIDKNVKDNIEQTVTTSFINGLPSDLLVSVKLEQCYTFEDCMITAIQLLKTIEAENARKRIISRPNISPCADYPYVDGMPRQSMKNNPTEFSPPRSNATPFIKPLVSGTPGPNYPSTKICRYCKTPGHFMNECRKLAYKRATEGNYSQPSTSYNQNNSGNVQGVPERNDARRNETQIGRPTLVQPTPVNTTLIQEPVPSPDSASAT